MRKGKSKTMKTVMLLKIHRDGLGKNIYTRRVTPTNQNHQGKIQPYDMEDCDKVLQFDFHTVPL